MLDSFTTNTCLDAWGRTSYARALIEIESCNEFKDNLVVGVPSLGGNGLTKQVVRVEYEWKPPRCSTCLLFGHDDCSCPKAIKKVESTSTVDSEWFTVVGKKKNKGKQVDNRQPRQVEGIRMTKPKPQFVYRPKSGGGQPSSSGSQQQSKPDRASGSYAGFASTSGSSVPLKNSYDVLNDDPDSDTEVVYEEKVGEDNIDSQGASTPSQNVSDV